ncbi:MFS transporter [Gordonia sp. X0973]|uniref:MFS transporter n=1 Tax=Gordonia sp. X0973 TaxID=2742602 RepID=UPI001581737C|nr:MFS transporter [Gordonia sp. X0973]QKT08919.1 MFS transporter [Gordonia sp. X0973]
MLIRLLATRLAGQAADGVFQAALFAAIAFNPEHQASPLAMAGALVVLVGPYSLVGPLIGGLLDRWDRRVVLLWANVIRSVLIVVTAGLLLAGLRQFVVLGAALVVMGASRFVAAGMSAALPHVTDRESLITLNAVFTTLGGVALMGGVGIAAGARMVLGAGTTGAAWVMLVAVALGLLAALLALTFSAGALGPDLVDDPPTTASGSAGHVGHGVQRGVEAIIGAPSVALVLGAIGAHRAVFGINTLVLLVLANSTGESAGLRRFLLLVGATALGALLAAFTTPVAVHHLGRTWTLAGSLAVGIGAQTVLLTFNLNILVVAVTIIGWVGQTVKLCGDLAMQLDIADDTRGEVFAIQDAVFNLTFIAAALAAALLVPATGHAAVLIIVGALIYTSALAEVVRRRLVDQVAPIDERRREPADPNRVRTSDQ